MNCPLIRGDGRKLIMEDYEKLKNEYMQLNSWEEYEAFREKHRDFIRLPFDAEMKKKFNWLVSPGVTEIISKVHVEVIDKTKDNPFGNLF